MSLSEKSVLVTDRLTLQLASDEKSTVHGNCLFRFICSEEINDDDDDDGELFIESKAL